MLDILKLIYKANNLGIFLWTEDCKLKYKLPKSLNDKNILNQLGKNKKSIISLSITCSPSKSL